MRVFIDEIALCVLWHFRIISFVIDICRPYSGKPNYWSDERHIFIIVLNSFLSDTYSCSCCCLFSTHILLNTNAISFAALCLCPAKHIHINLSTVTHKWIHAISTNVYIQNEKQIKITMQLCIHCCLVDLQLLTRISVS